MRGRKAEAEQGKSSPPYGRNANRLLAPTCGMYQSLAKVILLKHQRSRHTTTFSLKTENQP